jgi:hypothetical protein
MKPIFAVLLLFKIACIETMAQHPLIGTWELVSIKGINADGEKFSEDTSTIREIKIITATHYMLIAHDVEGDSLAFNRCYAGTVEFDDTKYIEAPLLASVPIFENVKTDFTWKIDGDKFTQAGTLVRPDGKKITIEELIFQRSKTAEYYSDNPSNGTWKLLSTNYTRTDGTKHADTEESVNALQMITPTHWMYVSNRDKKFEHAMGGSYSKQEDKYLLKLDFASFSKKRFGKTEMREKLVGDVLTINGSSTFPDGKKFTWEDVFQRVK